MTMATFVTIPFILVVPAFLIWSALSVVVFIRNGRALRRDNYRLAVTCYLIATALIAVDQVRLRLKLGEPDAVEAFSTWPVLILRWIWAGTVWWATAVLYGAYAHRWVRDRFRKPRPDPYLPDASTERNVE